MQTAQSKNIKIVNLVSMDNSLQFRHSSLQLLGRLVQPKPHIGMLRIQAILVCHIIITRMKSFHLELLYLKIK